MAICRHWKRGHCQLGDRCGFQHPGEEIFEIPTSDQGHHEMHIRGHADRMIRVS